MPSNKKEETISQENRKEIIGNICDFLAKHGLPINSIENQTFRNFITSLNPEFEHTNQDEIMTIVESSNPNQLAEYDVKKYVTVTMSFVRKADLIFLCSSFHFVDESSKRQSIIHLQALKYTQFYADEIIQEFHKISEMNGNKNIWNVVVMNSEWSDIFEKTGIVDKCFICFNTYISNFANSIIELDVVTEIIKKMSTFFRSLEGIYSQENGSTKQQNNMKQFDSNFNGKFPNVQNTENASWVNITVFLVEWFSMNKSLQSYAHTYQLEYISLFEKTTIIEVMKTLVILVKTSHEMGKENATMSQVIPKLKEIRKFIIRNTLYKQKFLQDINRKMKELFDKHNPFLWHQIEIIKTNTLPEISIYYEVATLLDPRFAFSPEIFSPLQWKSIKDSFINMIVKNENAQNLVYNMEIAKRELFCYGYVLRQQIVVDDPFTWWEKHRTVLPILYNQAQKFSLVPACIIDGKYLFGSGSKYGYMVANTDLEHLNDILKVTSRNEKYRGTGLIYNKNLLIGRNCFFEKIDWILEHFSTPITTFDESIFEDRAIKMRRMGVFEKEPQTRVFKLRGNEKEKKEDVRILRGVKIEVERDKHPIVFPVKKELKKEPM